MGAFLGTLGSSISAILTGLGTLITTILGS
jgi:hypothetical protein